MNAITKESFVVISAFFGGIILAQADIKASGVGGPVLQYFAALEVIHKDGQSSSPEFGFDSHKPLLTIASVRDVIVGGDGQGVTVVLHKKDKQRFADLTHKYVGQLLVCAASEDVFSIGIITSPTDDGIIEFSEARHTGNMADYLRRRFGK